VAEVTLEHVKFHYDASQPILHDFNLRLCPGTLTAVVGPSGSGKSTIANLIAGMVRPTAGKVTVNRRPLEKFTSASWCARLGYVSQEPFLFNDTVYENIRCGRQDATREQVEAAARKSGAAEFIERLDAGYDTSVGEGGSRLSGGQRQRLAIARALLREADVYIFDEATSALDSETKGIVQDTLERLKAEGKLIVLVTHDHSLVVAADQIVDMMDRGHRRARPLFQVLGPRPEASLPAE
jgi:ATP-binding cassette subfamily B protein